MTRDENWDGKVYKVFIRSTQIRSAGGRFQQQQHGVGDAAFSFRSPVTDHGGELGIERIKQLYFDANATWPLHEGVGIDDVGRFSHADEQFNYKGQLLPLHLRARLQMVEKLLYDIKEAEAEIKTSSSTILLLLLLRLFVVLVFSKLQGRQLLNP